MQKLDEIASSVAMTVEHVAITVEEPTTPVTPSAPEASGEVPKPTTDNRQPTTHNPQPTTDNGQPKVSALSLSSIRAKKELAESQKSIVKVETHSPSESFTENEMLEYWFKYAQRLGDKGHKIMESLLTNNVPVLNGTTITVEVSNKGSKIDFESEESGLLGYLKGHLHNHDIAIEVNVNESMPTKKAFTAQDKFNRLNEINPNLELLKKMFDLDV